MRPSPSDPTAVASSRRLRLLLTAAAVAPVFVAGGVAVSPLGGDALVPLVAAGSAGSLLVTVVAWVVIARLSAAAEWVRRMAAGDLPEAPDGRDELAGLLSAVRAAEGGRRHTLQAYKRTLNEVAGGMGQVADGATVSPLKESGPCAAEANAVTAAFQDAGRKVGVLRKRLSLVTKVISELPAAVVAVDDQGVIRYANGGFERLTGRPGPALANRPLGELLDAVAADPFDRPALVGENIPEWLAAGAADERVAVLTVAGGAVLRAAVTAAKIDGTWYLHVRDLIAEYERLAADRGRTREECLRAAWGTTARTETESLDVIQALVRLLTGDAKQSTGRETMLPRLATVRQHVGELDAHVRTLRWLHQALWGQLPAPLTTEFQAVEPIRAAVEQLAPRFKSRNVIVTVSDEGGWVCGDDEWIRTAILGVLAHAAGSARDGTVGVRLRRLPPAGGSSEDRVAYEVVDAGPPLTPLQFNELSAPFGGLDVPSYLAPTAAGFLPGLVLAAELVRRMAGEWELDTTPSGGLIVRFVLPTRVPGGVTTVAATAAGDTAPLEELVMGWKLGTA